MDAVPLVTAVLVTLLLSAAAWRDVATRLIPDALPLAILALGLASRALSDPLAAAPSLGVAVLLLAACLALVAGGLLGGGDAKLAAAVASALPPSSVPDFLLASVLAGGMLGAGYLAAARLLPAAASSGPRLPGRGLLARVGSAESRRLRRGGPVPYAVALAAGGAFVLLAGH